MADTGPHRKLSRLESLPGELRNRIYRYAVVEEEALMAVKLQGWKPGTWITVQPNLASVCKQFRHEALSVYYSENIFLFGITTQWCHDVVSVVAKRIDPFLRSIAVYGQMIKRVGASVTIKNDDETNGTPEELRDCVLVATLRGEDGTAVHNLCPPLDGYCECEFETLDQQFNVGAGSNHFDLIRAAWSSCYMFAGKTRSVQQSQFCKSCSKKRVWNKGQ